MIRILSYFHFSRLPCPPAPWRKKIPISDWFENSFIMDVDEENFSRSLNTKFWLSLNNSHKHPFKELFTKPSKWIFFWIQTQPTPHLSPNEGPWFKLHPCLSILAQEVIRPAIAKQFSYCDCFFHLYIIFRFQSFCKKLWPQCDYTNRGQWIH